MDVSEQDFPQIEKKTIFFSSGSGYSPLKVEQKRDSLTLQLGSASALNQALARNI